MNTILNCHIVCQCSGCMQSCTECKCNIGGQCRATAADKTVKAPVIVTQAQNNQNPSNSTEQLEAVSRPSKYIRILAGKVVKRKDETTTETVRKMTPLQYQQPFR